MLRSVIAYNQTENNVDALIDVFDILTSPRQLPQRLPNQVVDLISISFDTSCVQSLLFALGRWKKTGVTNLFATLFTSAQYWVIMTFHWFDGVIATEVAAIMFRISGEVSRDGWESRYVGRGNYVLELANSTRMVSNRSNQTRTDDGMEPIHLRAL